MITTNTERENLEEQVQRSKVTRKERATILKHVRRGSRRVSGAGLLGLGGKEKEKSARSKRSTGIVQRM